MFVDDNRLIPSIPVGSFDDLAAVLAALQGVYGAWVNTDSFTVGEQKEVFLGIRIFELAKQVKNVRHYVWSSLDYVAKVRVDSFNHCRCVSYNIPVGLRKGGMIPNTELNITTARRELRIG